MSLTFDQLVAGPPPSPEAIDAFFEGKTFPLVEGRRVTYVFRGQADRVRLRHFIFGLPSSQPFHRVEGTDRASLVVSRR